MENLVGFIEVKPRNGQTNIPLDIAFSQNDNKKMHLRVLFTKLEVSMKSLLMGY
jgi:hypothetical protein